MRLLVTATIILIALLAACSDHNQPADHSLNDDDHSYEASLRKTASEAAKLAAKNQQFQLGKFIEGRWRGNCHPEASSSSEIVFENGRAWIISYAEGLEGGSAFEHGLFEILSEDTIVFHRMALDSIQVQKTGENSFVIPETGSQMIYYAAHSRDNIS